MLHNLRISKKLTFVIFFSNIIVLVLVFVSTAIWNVSSIKDSHIESAKSAVKVFGQDFTKILVYDSPHIAADTVSRLRAIPFIKNAVLYNLSGKPAFHYASEESLKILPPVVKNETTYFSGGYLHIFSNLNYQDKQYGSVYYRVSTDLLDTTLKNYAVSIAAFLLLVVLISFLMSYRFQRIFSAPVVKLAELVGKVTHNDDFTIRAHTNEKNEIGKLYDDFNTMIEHIDKQQKELQEKNRELLDHRDQLKSQVDERTRELYEYTKELEAFSYSVSHDLRAPLRAINGFSTLLLEEYGHELESQGKNYLERIANSSNRMGELIDDLLQLSKINQHDIKKKKINLSHIVSDVLNEKLGDQWNQNNAAMDIKLESNIFIVADPNLMRIVIDNLIGNAIKYSSAKSLLSLEIGCDCSDRNAKIYIKDQGIGFDMQFVNKIFKPFERLHPADKYDGTGIGLATVKRIIERHGGKIWAEGKLNTGSVFYFQLPDIDCHSD